MPKKNLPALRPSEKLLAASSAQVGPQASAPVKTITLHTMAEILTLSSYTSEHLRDDCRSEMARIKTGLGYDAAPELERLLIEEIAMCWLRVGEAEAMYSQIMSDTHNADKALYGERRLSACLARYVRSCEALARVRRLSKGVPAIQVNIAEQQIVAG